MLKIQAINLFGGTPSGAAIALGISYQAVTKWPDVLPTRIADRVLGACVRNGVAIPPEFRPAAELLAAQSSEEPLTADPALNADLARAEQAGLVKLPHQAKPWDGVKRRVAKVQRRAVDRNRDIAQTGQGS